MQENQGVDLIWLGKLEIELSRLHAWPICCAVGNTSRFAQCSGSQMKHDAIKNILPLKCDWSDEGLILPCILSDSALRSVVSSWVNIDRDWLPVDHWINHVHWSNERVRAHGCVEKSWRQQVCMLLQRGKKSKWILQVCIWAISLQRIEIQPWLLLICHQSKPNNSCSFL